MKKDTLRLPKSSRPRNKSHKLKLCTNRATLRTNCTSYFARWLVSLQIPLWMPDIMDKVSCVNHLHEIQHTTWVVFFVIRGNDRPYAWILIYIQQTLHCIIVRYCITLTFQCIPLDCIIWCYSTLCYTILHYMHIYVYIHISYVYLFPCSFTFCWAVVLKDSCGQGSFFALVIYINIVELRAPAMPVGVGGGKERGGFHLN